MFDELRVFELTTNTVDATATNTSAKTTGAMIVFPTLGVWHHYWKNKVVQVPEGFQFPRNKTLLSLW